MPQSKCEIAKHVTTGPAEVRPNGSNSWWGGGCGTLDRLAMANVNQISVRLLMGQTTAGHSSYSLTCKDFVVSVVSKKVFIHQKLWSAQVSRGSFETCPLQATKYTTNNQSLHDSIAFIFFFNWLG